MKRRRAKKRRAEVLMEYLAACFFFVAIMSVILEFVLAQLVMVIRVKSRDDLMYEAHYSLNYYNLTKALMIRDRGDNTIITLNDANDPSILTGKKKTVELTLKIK